MLKLLSECFPPFSIFIIGVGNWLPWSPPIYEYKDVPKELLAAIQHAKETPNMVFAPKLFLLSVPSNLINSSSIFLCSYTLKPINFFAIFLIFSTGVKTPFPPYLLGSLSRSSHASKLPVEAPEGTMAVPQKPPSVITSTCTVGFPLESKTSKPLIELIAKKSFINNPPIKIYLYCNQI